MELLAPVRIIKRRLPLVSELKRRYKEGGGKSFTSSSTSGEFTNTSFNFSWWSQGILLSIFTLLFSSN